MYTRISILIVASFFFTAQVGAVTYPTLTPTGETPGGVFQTYFDNMYTTTQCNTLLQVVAGFSSTGVPICVTPTAAGFSMSGQTSGDTVRYTGTSWVRTNFLYNNGTNIGINTTSPSATLDVNGTLRLRVGSPGVGKYLVSSSNGTASWIDPVPTLSGSYWAMGGNTLTGTRNLGTISNHYLPIITNNVERVRIDTAGNVGIGTTTPGAKLEVAGQVKITGGSPGSGRLLVSDSGGLASWVPASTIGVGGFTYNANSDYSSISTIARGPDLTDMVFQLADNALDANFSPGSDRFIFQQDAAASQGGDAFQKYPLVMMGKYAAFDPRYSVTQNSTTLVYGSGTMLSATAYMDYVNRRLGVGTITPAYTLDVNGTGNFLSLRMPTGAAAGRVLTSDASGIASWQLPTVNGIAGGQSNYTARWITDTTLGTGALYDNGTNIGIGMTSPSARLDVNGDVLINSIALGRGAGNVSTNSIFGASALNSNISGGNNVVNGGFGLYSNTVGSNNTAQGYSSLYRNTIGSNNVALGYYAGYSPSVSLTGTNNTFIGANTTYTLAGLTNATAIGANTELTQSNSVIIGSGANVGIGTSAPGVKLDVNGAIRTSNEFISTNANQARFVSGNYGVIHRNDGSNYWLLLTNSGDSYGSWNGLRPFAINTASGHVQLGNNALYVQHGANVGIGTITPGAKLEVAGQIKITGGSPGSGRILTSDSTGLAVWSNGFSGSVTASGITGGTQNLLSKFGTGGNGLFVSQVFDNGSNVGIGTITPGAKLEVAGQIKITGGSPGSGRILTSDSTGLAVWSNGFSGSVTASGITGGAQGYLTRFGTGGNGLLSSVIFQSGSSVAIGTGMVYPGYITHIDSGVDGRPGIRFARVNSTSPVFTGGATVPLGVNANGEMVPVQGGMIPVYTALGSSPNAAINTSTEPPTIGANYDRYFNIGARQSFVVTDVTGNPYNCPEFQVGSSNKGTTGCTQTPWASYVMTAQNATSGNRYGYQIMISDRTDAPFVVRGGTYSAASGTLMNSAMTIPALWFKAITVPTNRSDWFYINPGVDQNNNPIAGGGNIGIGTLSPTAKLDLNGQIKITDGTQGAGKILTSDASGVASWATGFSGSVTASGITGGTQNYVTKFGTGGNGIVISRIFDNGSQVGIGTITPLAGTELDVTGDARFTGDVTVQGKLITDTIVNRTVNNVSISGSLLPDSIAPLIYRDIGSSAQRWNNLYLSGQVTIAGGSPGLGKVLTSDASGLAIWSNGFSGSVTASGITGGTQNYVTKFGTGGNGIVLSQIFDTGTGVVIGGTTLASKFEVWSGATSIFHMRGTNNLGLGIASVRTATSGTANVGIGNNTLRTLTTGYSNAAFGDSSLYGNTTGYFNAGIGTQALYSNSIGNWNTALGTQALWTNLDGNNNVALGGQALYSNSTNDNNVAIGYQALRAALADNNVAIGYNAGSGITTGASNILIGANTAISSNTSSNQLNIGNWIYGSGGNIGIGTGLSLTTKFVVDSGINNISGIRMSRISSNSTVFTGSAVGLGVDANGNIVPVSNGDVVVYDALGRNDAAPSPDPDIAGRRIRYDFNKYFQLPTKQSFVVSNGNGAGYNAPYFKEDGVSGICSYNGAGGTSPYDCATADPATGLSASPNNSFTMTARGDNYGYQIALGARGDAPLFARSGKWYNGGTNYGSGLYLSDGTTPTPWQKVLTVPANHIEYFYVNIGYNSQLQPISGGGNVGMGTSNPDMRLVLSQSGTTGSTSRMMRIERGVRGADSNMVTTFGTPYLMVGGKETRTNSIQTIGFGYSSGTSMQPAEIGFLTTNTAGNTLGDILFATRSVTTNITPTERMRIGSNGNVAIGTGNTSGTAKLKIDGQIQITGGGVSSGHVLVTDSTGLGYWRNVATLGVGGFNYNANSDFSSLSTLAVDDDMTDMVFQLADNAIDDGDRFVFQMDQWSDINDQRYPLVMNGVYAAFDPRYSLNFISTDNQYASGNLLSATAYMDYVNRRFGIGTITPSANLHLSGSLRIMNGTQANGRVLTSDANGNATWQVPSGGSTSYKYYLTSAVSRTSNTFGDLGLTSVSLPVGYYNFSSTVRFRTAATTTGLGLGLVANGATVANYAGQFQAQATTNTLQAYSDSILGSSALLSTAVPAANTDYVATFNGVFQVTSPGSVKLQFRSEVNTSNVTIQPGSNFIIEPL